MIRRTVRAERGILTVMALLVLATAFLTAAVPRLLANRYDAAVREHITQAAPLASELAIWEDAGTAGTNSPIARDAQLAGQLGQIRAALPATLHRVISGSDYWANTQYGGIIGRYSQQLSVGRSSSADAHITYISGHPPGAGDRTALEVGLAAGAAQKLNLKVGDTVRIRVPGVVTARITGLFTPRDPQEAYWVTRPGIKDSSIMKAPDGSTIVLGTGLLSAQGYDTLYAGFPLVPLRITWTYATDPSRVTAADAAGIAAAVKQADVTTANIEMGDSHLRLDTRLDQLLQESAGQLRAAQTVISLSLAGLIAIAIGVIVLADELLLVRLSPALAIMRARGASQRQIAGLVAGVTACTALPAACAGFGLALLAVRGGTPNVAILSALGVVAAAIPLPALMAARAHRRAGRGERRDVTTARPSPRRLGLEALVTVLALTATYLLRRRGVGGEEHGVDPLLSLVPVLLALACGLFTVRAYPFPLRVLGRLAGRTRSSVPFLGIARASRQGFAVTLPLMVLLLANVIAGFSMTVDASIARTQRVAAWQTVGGDVRLDGDRLTDADLDRLRHAPGLRGAVPAKVIETASMRVGTLDTIPLSVIGIDLDAYRRLMNGTPVRVPPAPGGPGVPALLSPAAAKLTHRSADLTLSGWAGTDLRIRDSGIIEGFPGQDPDTVFAVIPATDLTRAGAGAPTTVFVRGAVDPAALARATSDAGPVTMTYRAVHEQLVGLTLVRLVHSAFGYGALAAVGYAVLAVLFTLMIGERGRSQAVTFLRTLGLSRRQARWLALVELAPVLLSAAIVGWALGLVVPHVLGAAMDLRAYTAQTPITRYLPDLATAVTLAVGLLVFAGAAVLTHTAVIARRRSATALRMGEQG
jgi:putative ABC transport system permease protein